ncbi:hypothetical protein LSUE1_G002956 [Lachnellula suecica]|uniref:C2H2-type domain-containing protein n=1 Tax=Lachnellula suecica TaxID=602035 RepID=A0A8T9CER5_9HELO|nr:hypothetical protein LSUE1_G002956 [Lachnellula suecica]
MSPTSSRSSSISSSSTSSSKTSEGIKKKFGCSFPNCGKSFSRSEHLHRHALNHKDGNNTCMRCSAHFRRRDLLDRHMARHKEKDDEAGGPGLGILATRKRLWRDTDGKIVNSRRPSYTQEGSKRRQLSHPERKSSRSSASDSDRKLSIISSFSSPSPAIPMSRVGSVNSSTIIVDTGREDEHDIGPHKIEPQDSWLEMSALPSPPISDSDEPSLNSEDASPSADAELSEFDALYEDTWAPLAHNGISEVSPLSAPRQSEYPNPSWSPQPFQTFMGAMSELPYDDIFKPEAGLYDWQAWNSQVLMSRCREEKFDPFEERKREWSSGFLGRSEESFRRPFGLGTC